MPALAPALVPVQPCEAPREESFAQPPMPAHEAAVIAAALAILHARLRQPGASVFDTPGRVRDFLTLHLADRDTEAFAVMYLDCHHSLIEFEVPFTGTLTQATVYPREIVRRALHHNAAAVVLSHCHPSGRAEPSRLDEYLTETIKATLALVDCRVLDHVVIGGRESVSFAERGLL